MIKEKTEILSIYNPYTSAFENLVCRLEIHLDKSGKLDGACLMKIISDSGENLMDWLKPERTEEIESDFMVEYNV